MTKRAALAAVIAVAAFGCGDGGSSGSGDAGTLGFQVLWESPDGAGSAVASADAFASTIPNAVNTVRISLTPVGAPTAAGCCVAVGRGTQAFADRILLLDGLVPGGWAVGLRGYATAFAPADGAGSTCATDPPSAGSACDPGRRASPSFDSDGVTVTIEAGARSDAGDILLYSVPFPVTLTPAEDELATGPDVAFTGVIADAANDVVTTSIDVSMGGGGSAPTPIQLDPFVACDDIAGGNTPTCSAGGALEVRGYRVTGTGVSIAGGPATLNIVATNVATPPRALDFSYAFQVGSASSTTTTTPVGSTSSTTTSTLTGSTSSTTTTTLIGSTTTTTTTTSTTTTTPIGSTSSTTLAPQAACTVTFGTDDSVDLSGISFEVDYSAAPGDFVGSGDAVQCMPANGLSTASTFNDQDSARTLIAGLVTVDTIVAPTDLVVCDFLGALPPIDTDFVVTVREAFDANLAVVPVVVKVSIIECAP